MGNGEHFWEDRRLDSVATEPESTMDEETGGMAAEAGSPGDRPDSHIHRRREHQRERDTLQDLEDSSQAGVIRGG
jgi:hypothetical protein